MKRLLAALSLTSVIFFIAACSGNSDPYQAYRGMTSHQLIHDAEMNLAEHNYDDAAKELDAMDSLYPFGPYAKQGQLDIIYAYYMDSQMEMADAAALRFLHLYPRDQHADYALYMKSVINFERGMTWLQRVVGVNPGERDSTHLKQAYADLKMLVREFPHSKYRLDAARRMAYIRNVLAQQEVAVGEYYFKRRAYVAAVNRANNVILHYEGAPAVPNALHLAIQAYQKLGQNKMAAKYQKMLNESYPAVAS